MKYKYLSISGRPVETEDERAREEIISSFEEDGEVISVTPVCEIDGVEYWNSNTQYGFQTRETWVKKVCPQLRKIYR